MQRPTTVTNREPSGSLFKLAWGGSP